MSVDGLPAEILGNHAPTGAATANPDALLAVMRHTRWEDVVNEVVTALMDIVPLGEAPEAVKITYPEDPENFEERWPAVSCELVNDARGAGASNEIKWPNLLRFAVRSYYPLDDTQAGDPGRKAQRMVLASDGAYLDAVIASRNLGQRVFGVEAPEGRRIGRAVGRNRLLLGYERDTIVRLH